MANYPNNSIAYLITSKLASDKSKTIDFTSATDRNSYFISQAKYTVSNCTYIRKDNTLTINFNADKLDAEGINYVMYNNPEISGNRWFFAFVTSINFVAMKTTVLKLETDVFTTYQFDIVKNECFVERMHVDDDTRGAHTLLENVPIGSGYYYNKYSTTDTRLKMDASTEIGFNTNYVVGVLLSELPKFLSGATDGYAGGNALGGYLTAVNLINLKQYIDDIVEDKSSDNILSVFSINKNFVTLITLSNTKIYTVYAPFDTKSLFPAINVSLNFDSFGGGYTPRNQKLNTYPFRFLTLKNFNGQNVQIPYEHCNIVSDVMQFYIDYALGINATICLRPLSVDGISGGADYSVTSPASQPVPYSTSLISDYFSRNANSLAVSLFSDALSISTSAASGEVSSVVSGGMGILSKVAALKDIQKRPNAVHGLNSANMLSYIGQLGVCAFDTFVYTEYAKLIDDYFDMFGYNVSSQMYPNWTTRQNYNYIKTIGCCLSGDIPQRDLQQLNALFDAGLTVWHSPSQFGYYAQNNPIV